MFKQLLNKACIVAILTAGAIQSLCAQSRVPAVESVLDEIHATAAKGDWKHYFPHFAKDSIFLGTDASERWSKSQLQHYASLAPNGWTYQPKERHVFLAGNGKVAWFDEKLWSPKYGEMRGTGVLVKFGNTWKLEQYSLLKPIPNNLFAKVVELIRQTTPASPDEKTIAPVK